MLYVWAVLLVCAISSGFAACGSLVAPRRSARWAAFGAGVLGAGASYVLIGLARAGARADTILAAGFIGLGAFVGGFALCATLLPSLTRGPGRTMPRASAVTGSMPVSDDAHTAFVFVADGQVEHYRPALLTEAFARLAATEVPVPPDVLRVFAYTAERARYHAVGISPARAVVRTAVARASGLLREAGWTGPVLEAWLEGVPRLADSVAEAARLGASTVVVTTVGVSEPWPMEEARAAADVVARGTSPVRVVYSPPLWTEEALVELVASRVLAELPAGPRATDGIVLVGQGQPWQWDRLEPHTCEQETFFLQRVRASLVAAGAEESNVRTAWLDWQDPAVTEVVRHVAALGAERIVVAPASFPADKLETIIDLPVAVEQAAIDPSIRVEVLRAWGDDDTLARVLAEAAGRTAREAGVRPD